MGNYSEFIHSIDNETGKVEAAYLRVRSGKVADTREVVEGKIFMDYSGEGELLGVEFLPPCTVDEINLALSGEPDFADRGMKKNLPLELLSA
jgi:uncharacterized protein YuzE